MSEVGLKFRTAARGDLPAVVDMLANDALGAMREQSVGGLAPAYEAAFAAIEADPNHDIIVAELDDTVVGVLQLSFIPHLTYTGGWRAQIEGVRVAEGTRSRGVGRALLTWAIARARERGCHLVQLTTDQRRPEALAFYRSLGFRASHHGMKLHV